tara:strand:+ start:400 stop:543 length:144 start_codon:yes stop_codon:yes gene_type:complete
MDISTGQGVADAVQLKTLTIQRLRLTGNQSIQIRYTFVPCLISKVIE